jgi:WS/DGAT/MGAT family acyltransferase
MVARHAPMAPADSILCTIEADPVLRSTIIAVARCDRPPDRAGLAAALGRAVEALPRLRSRIAEPLWPVRPRRWEEDPAFALDHHLRFVRVGGAGDLRAVLDLAARFAEEAFDPARPRWVVWVVEGLDGDRAALVLKVHHAITDGVGGMGLALQVLADEEAAAPAGPARPATGAGAVARRLAGAAADPLGTVRSAAALAGSLVRVLAPATRRLSPLLQARGLDRRLDVFDVPIAGLRAAADRAGGTLNDAYLAAVTGGLARYHERLGAPVDRLRATLPISIRRPDDPPGGNRFVPARLVLPVAGDPLVRARTAGAIVRRWRAEPAFELADRVAAVLDRLPPPLVVRLFGGMLKNVDVDIVNVPGAQRPFTVGGARVERFWAFAPPAGTAVSITLLSHAGNCCVGINADTAAVGDPEALCACLREGFAEVVAAGHPRARRRAAGGA